MRLSTLENMANPGGGMLRLVRVHPRSPSHLLLEYADDAGELIPAQWLADLDRLRSIWRAMPELEALAPSPTERFPLLLQPGGADRRLPGLARLVAQPGITILSHRPERRAVLLDTREVAPRYLKLIRPDRAAKMLTRYDILCIQSSRPFAIPILESIDMETGCFAFGVVEGTPLDQLPADTVTFASVWNHAGVALRAFHAIPADELPAHTAQDESRLLCDRVGCLGVFIPELASELSAHLESVCEGLRCECEPACLVHRDFYEKQLIATPDASIAVLDFDTMALGEPAIDLANALVHIELRALQGHLTGSQAQAAAAAFIEGYSPESPTRSRIPAYADATRLRLACLYAYRPRWSSLVAHISKSIGTRPVGIRFDRESSRSTRSGVREVVSQRACKGHRHVLEAAPRTPASPFFFLVGCPRSGTTMLERMFDAHPLVAMAHETHWITKYNHSRFGVLHDGTITPALLDHLYEDRRFIRMGVRREQVEPWLSEQTVHYDAFVARVYSLFRRQRGKLLAGDKSTGGHIRDLDRLHAICPESQIVHLIRDGRAVALSMLSWPKASRAAGRFEMWNDQPLATVALWWRWHIRSIREGASGVPSGQYHEARYEDLVNAPEQQCEKLCETLGLPPSEHMASFHTGRTIAKSGLSPNAAWLPPTRGLRDWRAQMSRGDVELFEALAGDTLTDLGYERRFTSITPQVSSLASKLRERFDAELSSNRSKRSMHRQPESQGSQIPGAVT